MARALLLQWWQRNWTDDFAQRFFVWRYLSRPSGETLLALDKGKCVAILDSYLRRYLLSGRLITIRETCDWFCLPEYRPLGVGIRLMRQMMARPEPIVVIGGTEATQSLLPRLKFQRLPEVSNYLLPVSCRTVAAYGLRRFREGSEIIARLIPAPLRLRRPRRLPSPTPFSQMSESLNQDIPPQPSPDTYALATMIDADTLRWLALAPAEIGDLITLSFRTENSLVGMSTTRLEDSRGVYSQGPAPSVRVPLASRNRLDR